MSNEQSTKEFLKYFAHNHRRVYGYIRTQVRCASDADDILQETSAVLWEKFTDFDRSADFTRWACGIARRLMLRHFRTTGRIRPLFSEEVDERFVDQLVVSLESEDDRTEALTHCIEELQPRHRELLDMRYSGEQDVHEIADRIERSESAVYKSLARIHEALFDCIELRTAEWRTT